MAVPKERPDFNSHHARLIEKANLVKSQFAIKVNKIHGKKDVPKQDSGDMTNRSTC